MTLTAMKPCAQLQALLEAANLDDALVLVKRWDIPAILRTHRDPLEQLRLRCMIADVYDYAGLYDEARNAIEEAGKRARDRLEAFLKETRNFDPPEGAYRKQECWALMHWGMCSYREHNYDEAGRLFKIAKECLTILQQRGVPCTGSLSRAWYSIGLVYRQTYMPSEAMEAFTQSIELAERGIAERQRTGKPIESFEYSIGKCFGLGRGWVSYNEAFLVQARGDLVQARRLLAQKKARFITAYVDIVRACVLMSAYSDDLKRLEEAIEVLRNSYAVLEGNHIPYALRAANELAHAHLSRARLTQNKEDDLGKAQQFLEIVKSSDYTQKKDKRTYCNAFITESRIHRERGDKAASLKAAENAKSVGGDIKFTRIDCQITMGEAKFWSGDYAGATNEFLRGLDWGRNSQKILAVCHLHLARAYYMNKEYSKALEHFRTWENSHLGLENAFIRKLQLSVRTLLEQVFKDFTISFGQLRLPGRTYLDGLRRWLADTAAAQTNGDLKAAAALLGIAYNAYVNWQRKPRLPQ